MSSSGPPTARRVGRLLFSLGNAAPCMTYKATCRFAAPTLTSGLPRPRPRGNLRLMSEEVPRRSARLKRSRTRARDLRQPRPRPTSTSPPSSKNMGSARSIRNRAAGSRSSRAPRLLRRNLTAPRSRSGYVQCLAPDGSRAWARSPPHPRSLHETSDVVTRACARRRRLPRVLPCLDHPSVQPRQCPQPTRERLEPVSVTSILRNPAPHRPALNSAPVGLFG
jgi:hypothetical protein